MLNTSTTGPISLVNSHRFRSTREIFLGFVPPQGMEHLGGPSGSGLRLRSLGVQPSRKEKSWGPIPFRESCDERKEAPLWPEEVVKNRSQRGVPNRTVMELT